MRLLREEEEGDWRLPPPGQVPDEERGLPGGGGGDQGGREGGGGEVRWVHHGVQNEVEKARLFLQQPRLQAQNGLEHPHLGLQVEGILIQSELENIGQGPAFQPCDKNMQTVCERAILYPQETPSGNSQPPPRSWNFLPPCQELTFEKHQESESA